MGFTDHKLKFTIDADGKGAKRELSEVDRLIGKIGKTGAGIGDVLGGNLASSAISKLTGALLDGGRAVLDYSSRMEQAKIGFETLMGGSTQALQHLNELKRFAIETPFEFEDLTRASRRFQNVGLEAKKVIPVLKDIGNAAAAAGASSAELDSISLAFSQIIAKGKLSAEEVNQLAERGIPVWKMLSEQLGKSKADVIKLAEQGKISSDVFLDAFQRFSQANFGDAMQKQSKTFGGAMSSIKDMTLQAADEGFKPLYDEIVRYSNRMVQNQGEVQSWGKTTNTVLQNIIDGLHGANAESSQPGGLWDGLKSGLDYFDWYLRHNGAITQMFSEWAEGMRVAGAQARNLENGMLNLQDFTYNAPGGGTATPTTGAATPPAATVAPTTPSAAARVNTVQIDRADKQVDFDKRKYENRIKLANEYFENETQFFEAEAQTRITWADAAVAEGKKTEDDFARYRENLELGVMEYRKKMLAEYFKELAAGSDEYKRVEQRIRILDQNIETEKAQHSKNEADRKKKQIEDEQKLREVRNKSWNEYIKAIGAATNAQDEKDAKAGRARYEAGTVTGGTGIGAGIAQGVGAELVPMFDESTNAMLTFQERMALVSSDINNFVGQSLGGLIEGLGQMAAAWLAGGDISAAAALQMVASAAFSVATQAGFKAIFEFAEGLAAEAATFGVPNPSSIAHFAAAGTYATVAAIAGGVGVAAGLGARAAGGGSKSSSGGRGSSSSASSQQQQVNPYSRQTDDVYISGRRNTVFENIAAEIRNLHKKIGSMSPGEVLTAGARQKKGFIGTQAVDDMKTRPQLGTRMLRQANAR